MHHIRSNYLIQIKTICRETNTKFPNLNLKSDYELLKYLNDLLVSNNAIGLDVNELEIDLK